MRARSASMVHTTPIIKRQQQSRSGNLLLTVEDLETTTAKTSWISSARVDAPCPRRKSGPCYACSGTSRCPKSLSVSLGRSCALPARDEAERAQPGSAAAAASAASTNVSAPLRSRCCRRLRQ